MPVSVAACLVKCVVMADAGVRQRVAWRRPTPPSAVAEQCAAATVELTRVSAPSIGQRASRDKPHSELSTPASATSLPEVPVVSSITINLHEFYR